MPPTSTATTPSSSSSRPRSILRRRDDDDDPRPTATTDDDDGRPARKRPRPGVSFGKDRIHVDEAPAQRLRRDDEDDVGYDSDDLYDATASSSGGGLAVVGRDDDDDDDVNDPVLARREALLERRRRQRKRDDDDGDDGGGRSGRGRRRRGDFFPGEEPESSRSESSLLHRGNDDDDEDDESFDEDGNLKRKTRPRNDVDDFDDGGVPVEPFHMNEEREDGMGYFEGDTYVFRRGRNTGNEEEDAWADGLEETVVARRPSRRDDGNDDDQDNKTTTDATTTVSINEHLRRLHDQLSSNTDETVTRAMQRLGREKKQSKTMLKKRTNDEEDEDDVHQRLKTAESSLNEVIEHANALLMSDEGAGHAGVYEYTRARIAKILSLPTTSTAAANNDPDASISTSTRSRYFTDDATTAHANGEDGGKPTGDKAGGEWEWEYRGNDDGKIHGPYSTEQMLAWVGAGYFVKESAVDTRRRRKTDVGDKIKAATATVDDLMDDLMDDDEEEEEEKERDRETNPDDGREWQKSDTIDFKAFM